MLSFSVAIKKHKAASIGRAQGHNERLHPTASQLPRSAWFGSRGAVILTPWRQDRAEEARAMMKRKDAVVGIELSVQIGNQADWRELPSPEHRHGKPKRPPPVDLKKMAAAVLRAVGSEFGEANLVSATLHLDESTPHIQVIVTPIRDNKLQAKRWVGGAAKCAGLVGRLHAEISRTIPCSYKPGSGEGGKPHDPGKRAGANAPEPAGLVDKLVGAVSKRAERDQLTVERDSARQREQRAFAQAKRAALAAERAVAKAAEESRKAAEAIKRLEDEQRASAAAQMHLQAVCALLPAPVAPPPVAEVLERVCAGQRMPDGSYRVGRETVKASGQGWHVLGVMNGSGALGLLQHGLKVVKDAAAAVRTLLKHFTPSQVAGWLVPPASGGQAAAAAAATPAPVQQQAPKLKIRI